MSGIRRAITSLLCAVVATVLTPSAFVSADTPASGPSGVPSAGAGAPSAGAGAPGADDVSWAVQPSSEKGPNVRTELSALRFFGAVQVSSVMSFRSPASHPSASILAAKVLPAVCIAPSGPTYRAW